MTKKRALVPLALIGMLVLLNGCSLQLINAMPEPTQITIISPNCKTTYNGSIALIFTAQTYGTFEVDGREWGWGIVTFSYSLDNHPNVTLGISNGTLNDLSQGQHTLVIYAEREILFNGFLSTGSRDSFSSEQIQFAVGPYIQSSPTPQIPEYTLLGILPLFVPLLFIAVKLRTRVKS